MTQTDNDYRPPEDLWTMDGGLQFNEALEEGDPRYVPTDHARGDYSANHLFKTLGVDYRNPDHPVLRTVHDGRYVLFCGQRGCGKSTELRRIAERLDHPDAFFVVFFDIFQELRQNDIDYTDVLLILIKELFQKIDNESIMVEILPRSEKIYKKLQEFADAKDGEREPRTDMLPFSELFAEIASIIKSNSPQKAGLRLFIDSGENLHVFIMMAEEAVKNANRGRKILFVADGLDRLHDNHKLWLSLFNAHHRNAGQANFIYAAPQSLIRKNANLRQEYQHFFFPMINLHEKGKTEPLPDGYAAMKQMVYRRAHPKLFETPELVDELIRFSGGSPRELFKLLHYAFLRADKDFLSKDAVENAVRDLATDYRRILNTDDYPLLCRIEAGEISENDSKAIQRLTALLAVIEYEEGWREVHPAIKKLPEYLDAWERYLAAKENNPRNDQSQGRSEDAVFPGRFAPPVRFMELENLTVFEHSKLSFSPRLNVIIGENATGKTHLLKAIYAVIAALVNARRLGAPDKPVWESIITAKLTGVFRPEFLGRLVRHGRTECRIGLGLKEENVDVKLTFPAGQDGNLTIETLPESWPDTMPVFFPSRELLGIFPNFVSVYDNRYLEFEETWRDACVLLGGAPLREPPPETKALLAKLESFMGGKLELDRNGRFYLMTPDAGRMEIPLIAEGLRKLAMLARLIVTGALTSRGYLFWDEPESGMNPRLLTHLAQSLLALADQGVQVFVATHSLFFLRELEILLSHPAFKNLSPRFIGLHAGDDGVHIKDGSSIDDVGDIASLDEQLAQSDRYMELED